MTRRTLLLTALAAPVSGRLLPAAPEVAETLAPIPSPVTVAGPPSGINPFPLWCPETPEEITQWDKDVAWIRSPDGQAFLAEKARIEEEEDEREWAIEQENMRLEIEMMRLGGERRERKPNL